MLVVDTDACCPFDPETYAFNRRDCRDASPVTTATSLKPFGMGKREYLFFLRTVLQRSISLRERLNHIGREQRESHAQH